MRNRLADVNASRGDGEFSSHRASDLGTGAKPGGPPSFFLSDGIKNLGPFTAEEIAQKLEAGEVSRDSLICQSDWPTWKHLSEVQGFEAGKHSSTTRQQRHTATHKAALGLVSIVVGSVLIVGGFLLVLRIKDSIAVARAKAASEAYLKILQEAKTRDEMEAKVRTKAEAARARAEAEAKAAVERDALARFEAEVKAAASLAATNRVELIGKGMQRAGFKRESVIKTLTQGGTVVAWRWDGGTASGLSGDALATATKLRLVSRGWEGQESVPAGLNGVVTIAAGEYHTVALKADGSVVAWGATSDGHADIGGVNRPDELFGVVAIAAGNDHTVALKADGKVVAWGKNTFNQVRVPEGLSGVVAIAAGGFHTVALKADGSVVGWGYNPDGRCGVPKGLGSVMAIAAGEDHTVALKTNGTVVAWGDNYFGQSIVPGGLRGVVAITAGGQTTYALKADGTVVGWGKQLFQTKNLRGVMAIAVGGKHTLALKEDGTLIAWANIDSGRPFVPAGLSNVVAITVGRLHSVALRLD